MVPLNVIGRIIGAEVIGGQHHNCDQGLPNTKCSAEQDDAVLDGNIDPNSHSGRWGMWSLRFICETFGATVLGPEQPNRRGLVFRTASGYDPEEILAKSSEAMLVNTYKTRAALSMEWVAPFLPCRKKRLGAA